MEKREEKILELVKSDWFRSSYLSNEELLDQMVYSLMETDLNSRVKADAYFMVMNLKKLLKVICSDFYGYENLSQITYSSPKTEFERKIHNLITLDLEKNPNWKHHRN